MTTNGTCFCGEVTYKFEGELRDAASCHCSMCRKMFSSQASAHALIEPDKFSWLTGENIISTFKIQDGQDILFCSKCGSTFGGTFNNKVSWVTLGCLEGELNIELGMHVFVGSKAAWETIADGIPQHEAWPPENT